MFRITAYEWQDDLDDDLTYGYLVGYIEVTLDRVLVNESWRLFL